VHPSLKILAEMVIFVKLKPRGFGGTVEQTAHSGRHGEEVAQHLYE